MVDVANKIAIALCGMRDAICEPAVPWPCPDGGSVGNMTEALIYVGGEIGSVASAIDRLAEAVQQISEDGKHDR